jgi:rare lipoprotein A
MRQAQLAEKKSQALLQRKVIKPVALPTVVETPQKSTQATEIGKASYYADMFNGRTTASGEIFSNSNMTAAHKTLPFGTRVKVRNLSNGNTIEVVINDRGPFTPGRIIDLTSTGFSMLDNLSRGIIDVEIEIIE